MSFLHFILCVFENVHTSEGALASGIGDPVLFLASAIKSQETSSECSD